MLVRAKFDGRPVIPATEMDLGKLLRLDWAGTDGERYFIRSFEFLEKKYGRSQRVRFFKDWLDLDIRTICFWVIMVFHLRIHGSQTRSQQKGRRHLQPCEHNGGVSLSLIAKWFGRTKQWASYMRRKCEAEGLLRFSRRYKQVPRWEAEAREFCEDLSPVFYLPGKGSRLFREITSRCTVLYNVEFKWK